MNMNNVNPSAPRRRAQAGMSLLEALVALVVMAFGMLALAGMQLNLSRSADVAKQRTEAMRLAQERVEGMRSFTGISAGTINWNGLDGLTRTFNSTNTNATYAIDSSMSGADTDAMRVASVTVRWLDRAGDNAQVSGVAADGTTPFSFNQQVSLSTVISQTDPSDSGIVGNPLPLNRPLKRPKNRNINIPIPAVYLGAGTSATQFDANYVAIFSNLTANVVQICNPSQANATAAQINSAIAGGTACQTFNGYIIAGYIGRACSGNGNCTPPAWPTGINHSGITRNTAPTGTYSGIRCMFNDATNQNTGATITANNGYKYYLCVIPLATPFTWSGTVRLGGVDTTGDNIVCRYQYTQTTVTDNERNIQPYVAVSASIDEQNYLVATSNNNTNGSLAGSTTVCPSAMTVTGVSVGVLHQDCRSRNPSRATECPAPSP
jgi:type IV pilus modification protein PilV